MKKLISFLLVAVMLLTMPWLASCADLMGPAESTPEGSGGPSNPGNAPDAASKSWHYIDSGFPGFAEFSFDKDGKLVRIDNICMLAGYGYVVNSNFLYCTFNYESGKLIDSVAYGYEKEAGLTDSCEPVEIYRVKYVYGEDGKIVRGDFEVDGMRTAAYNLYSYDGDICTVKCFDKGELESMYRYDTVANRFTACSWYDFEFSAVPVYNEDGNVVEISRVDGDEMENIKVSYNDGRLAGFEHTENGSTERYAFSYNENGKILKVGYSDESGSTQNYSFEYDEKGRAKSVKLERTYGDRVSVAQLAYTFDENGMYSEAYQIQGDSKYVTKITRDEAGRVIKVEDVHYVGDEIQSSEISYTCTYNEKGQLIEKVSGETSTNYEYYENGVLKKVTSGESFTEYYENGLAKMSFAIFGQTEKILNEFKDHGINYEFSRGTSDLGISSMEGNPNADKSTITDGNGLQTVVERTFDDMHRTLSEKVTYPRMNEGNEMFRQSTVMRVYTYDENGMEATKDRTEDRYIYSSLESTTPVGEEHSRYTEYYEGDRTVREDHYRENGKMWAEVYYSYTDSEKYISKIVTYNDDGSVTVEEFDRSDNAHFPNYKK